MQAFTQNVHTDGEVWRENKVTSDKIIKYNENWTKQNKTFEDVFHYLWEVAENKKMFYTKKEIDSTV